MSPIGSVFGVIGFVRALSFGKKSDFASTTRDVLKGMPKVRAASDVVLGATDLADLADLLDEMFVGIVEFGSELHRMMDSGLEEVGSLALERVLGAGPASHIQNSIDRVMPRFEAMTQDLASDANTDAAPVDMSRLVEWVYTTRIPLAARESLIEIFHGILASLVIMRAVENGRPLQPWLSLALSKAMTLGLDKAIEGMSIYLPFLMEEDGFSKVVALFGPHFEEAKLYEDFLVSFYPAESTSA